MFVRDQPDVKKGVILPLMEQFYTIQGEGYYQGKAAYFIRLAGCDVGCTWCDVKESWDANSHPLTKIEEITETAAEFAGRIAVITGGEPLMYELGPLTQLLKNNGFRTHIETSGAYPLSGNFDWICLSPKKFKLALPEIIPAAHELKVIIYNRHDFKWAEWYAERVSTDCKLYLQPEWGKEEEMLPLILNYIQEDPKWTVSLQIHKYMNIP